MKLARHLILAVSAVSLAASPAVANAADAAAREATTVEESEALGGGLLNGETFILPLMVLIAVILALTVGSGDEPVSP